MIEMILRNWNSIVSIASVAWGAISIVYILRGIPRRVEILEEWKGNYELEKLPPRVTTLEGDVKRIEKEIYTIKADLQENSRVTYSTYQLVKEMRDEFVRRAVRNEK